MSPPNGGMSLRSLESSSTVTRFSPSQLRWGVSSNENGVYPPLYSPRRCPFSQTVEAVMAPPKSANTCRPRASAGSLKCRRYIDTNSYDFSSKLCHGSRWLVCGIVTCSKPESSKPGAVSFGARFALNRQLRFMGRISRPAAARDGEEVSWPGSSGRNAATASRELVDLRKSRRFIRPANLEQSYRRRP